MVHYIRQFWHFPNWKIPTRKWQCTLHYFSIWPQGLRHKSTVQVWVLATNSCQVFLDDPFFNVFRCLKSIPNTLSGVSSTVTLCWKLKNSELSLCLTSQSLIITQGSTTCLIEKITQQLLSNSNYYKRNDRKEMTSPEYTKIFWQFYAGTAKVLVFNI